MFVLLLFLLLFLSPLTSTGQTTRQLKVYQKTGMVDVVRMNANGSIRHSCTDLNGQVHPDYVTMVVTDAEGHERQYLLSQLDSLVLPSGQRVVFNGSMLSQPLYAPQSTEWTEHPRSAPRRTSFGGSFPGKGTGNVTFYWTENDHIRLDVGDESRAVNLTNNNTNAEFVFEDSELEAPSYMVYYPDKRVTIPTVQSQTKANNSDHIGPSGDCGVATATREGDSYNFTLQHKAAYLCFLPHIDHLPSARIEKITLNCTSAIAGTYLLSGSGLYNASQTSNTITLNLTPQRDIDFFIGHDVQAEQDTCAAYMVIAPQSSSQTFTATYYITDTLSRIEKVYRQTFSFQPVANTVYPVTCHILDEEFRSIDLGLSCNWSNVNVGATEPSRSGNYYATDTEANAALLEQTVVTEWLLPDSDQREELMEKCLWEFGEYSGESGYLITGAAVSKEYGKKLRIFIPCAEGTTKEQCLTQNKRPVEALMVDLGLSSGVKWAARNIGAASVEDYGNYYAWGEVETKDSYTSGNYKYGTRNLGNNYDISGTQNDAAVVNWGGIWSMPNYTNMKELTDSCSWTWSTINGVKGYIVKKKTGGTGNKIFMPAAGYMDGITQQRSTTGGVYLTSTQGGNNSGYAYTLGFSSGSRVIYNEAPYTNIFSNNNPFAQRRIGHSVRPVAAPNAMTKDGLIFNIHTDSTTWKLGDTEANLYATLSSTTPLKGDVTVGFVIGDSAVIDTATARFRLEKKVSVLGSYTLSQPIFDNIGYWYRAYVKVSDTIFYGIARHYGYEMVDLGLSVKWANMNIGADIPADYGNHYAWGELEPKEDYSLATYQWYKDNRYYNLGDHFNIAGTEEDVAHVKMGNAWRMPTNSEMEELKNNCSWKWTSQDNVSGYKVTGPSGNSIFLPAAGYIDGTTLQRSNSGGVYLTSTQGGNYNKFAYTLGFSSSLRVIYNEAPYTNVFSNHDPFPERRIGHSVRAVAVPNGSGTDGIVMNVLTDSVTWKFNDTEAVLHGTLSSTTPIEDDVTVGFIIGSNDSITLTTALNAYPQTVQHTGLFHQTVPVHDNIGYWYRTYVVHGGTVYYGKARHYALEMVDLGIGTLWANMNVDASSPEECGGYYAWGETSVKDDYSLAGYAGHISRLDQYINMGNDFCISNTDLDVAHVRMGNAWRMPTNDELTALKNQCTWTWTSQNNVSGYRVTGPNGNSIFLPAGGYKNGTGMSQYAYGCVYPSATQSDSYSKFAYTFAGNASQRVIYNDAPYTNIFSNHDPFPERRIGHTIRAVAIPNAVKADSTIVMNILTDSAVWKLRDTEATIYGTVSSTKPIVEGTKIGFVVGDSANITKSNATVYTMATTTYGSFSQLITGLQYSMGYWYRAYVEMPNGETFYGKARHFGLEMVDLGLTSGTLWANMNLGANNPGDYGAFYAWGETATKDIYTVENYAFGTTTLGVNGNIQGTAYDAAYACPGMGQKWCLPTSTEMSELSTQCTWKWTSEDNVSGWRVTGPNGKSIFLPAAGYKSYNNYYFENKCGSYMTATQGSRTDYCSVLDFTSSTRKMYSTYDYNHIFATADGNALRYVGHSVRPIATQKAQRP